MIVREGDIRRPVRGRNTAPDHPSVKSARVALKMLRGRALDPWSSTAPADCENGAMCVSPGTISVDGLQRDIACRRCWQCKANRVRDLVGRCIAESRSRNVVGTSVITLTYGTSDRVGLGGTTTLSAQILTYSDVQKWLKRLRNDGYPLRYVVAGEYGSKKGRAHWHVIAFWTERVPPHPAIPISGGVRWWEDPWWTGHPDSAGGHTFWDTFRPETAAYVCKYILKNEEDEKAQSFVRYSRRPLLGYYFIERLAAHYVSQGLVPDHNRYWFSDVIDPKTKKPRQYTLSRAALDYFLACYIALWEETRHEHPLDRQHSETVMRHMDRLAKKLRCGPEMRKRDFIPAPERHDLYDSETGEYLWLADQQTYNPRWFDEKLNCFVTQLYDGTHRYWVRDEWGNLSWCEKLSNGYVKPGGGNRTYSTEKPRLAAGSSRPT